MSEPETDETTDQPRSPLADDPLVREQEHKGYGEDEGEREDALEDD